MSEAISKVAMTTAIASSVTFVVSALAGGAAALFSEASFIEIFSAVGTLVGSACVVATTVPAGIMSGRQRAGLALSGALALGVYGPTIYNEIERQNTKPSTVTMTFNGASCAKTKVEVSADKSKVIAILPPGCYENVKKTK